MRILLHVPLARGSTRGNWITALRWEKILTQMGHTVCTVDPAEFESAAHGAYNLLIALHARRSADVITKFRSAAPQAKIIVALTGTDLHIDFMRGADGFDKVNGSIEAADRIVLLEPQGLKKLLPQVHSKCSVIYQSSVLPALQKKPRDSAFKISLLAHLREVKDPFLICRAAALLKKTSTASIYHAGEATTPSWEHRAVQWTQKSPRYQWLGPIPHRDALQLLANSQLTVLTSHQEGAPSVYSEAAALGVPILSTRIPASLGILGSTHPGLFDVHDAPRLANLIERAETDQGFYRELCDASLGLADCLSLAAESKAWKKLLAIWQQGQSGPGQSPG